MKLVSWNLGFAYGPYKQWHDRAWHWLAALDPDIALLQECAPSEWARLRWNVINLPYNRWASAVVARRELAAQPVPVEPDGLLGRSESYLATAEVIVGSQSILVASVHVRTAEATEDATAGFDRVAMARSSVGQPWFNDVAFAGYQELTADRPFVVGGDWNTARYLDKMGVGKVDGAEFLDRAQAAGWVEVSLIDGKEGRTWYGSRNPRPYQPDHIFADAATAAAVRSVEIDPYPVTTLGLSDHAPLILDIDLAATPAVAAT